MLTRHHRTIQNPARPPRMAHCFLIFLFLALPCIAPLPALAKIGIIAEVNGSVITNYQVEQRAAFLQSVTNLEDTEANRTQLWRDAEQMLIDEVLKLEAAKQVDPAMPNRVRKLARQLVDQNFARNGRTGTDVLRQNGIDADSVQQKFVADIVWNEYIKYRFSEKFKNIDKTVDKIRSRLEANAKKPQVKLSEIILLPEPKRPLKATLALANEIIKAVNRGADFNAIARQYSAAGTANNGGRVGWVIRDQLPPAVQQQLAKTPLGKVSQPIQQNGVVMLMRKEGSMENGVADPGQDIISLARATLRLDKNASNADKLEAAARLERDTASASSCEMIEQLNKDYKSDIPSLIENITISALAPQLRQKIETLAVNMPTAPIAFAEGVSVMMLCSRNKPTVNIPSRDDVYAKELDKMFGVLSERYLLRLRRAAVIERK